MSILGGARSAEAIFNEMAHPEVWDVVVETCTGPSNRVCVNDVVFVRRNGVWLPVRVLEVDEVEDRALVHFTKRSARHDRWVPCAELVSEEVACSSEQGSVAGA